MSSKSGGGGRIEKGHCEFIGMEGGGRGEGR